MKVVILCGGMGTRIRDVSELIPKPMVPIGREPIVWHILKYYASFGFKDFVLCLGYKKEAFIDYFLHYRARRSDVVIDLASPESPQFLNNTACEDWRVTLADTGIETLTGSRLKRAARYLDDSPFMLTYGDGLCDIDLRKLLDCHKKSGKLVTVSAVHPAGRFGEIELDGPRVTSFAEKPQTTQGYINGGFMVMEKAFVEKYIDNDTTCVLEADALARCARDGQLNAYTHDGFWQCMDTAREHQLLNDMWAKGAPWKAWE